MLLSPQTTKLAFALFVAVMSLVGTAVAQEKVVTPDEALLEAARVGDAARIRTALQNDALVDTRDKNGKTALILAAEGGYPEAVRFLLRKDAAPNVQDNNGDTALLLAAGANSEQLEVIQSLLQRGAQLGIKNRAGQTALHKAVEKGRLNIVRLFLTTDALSPNDRFDAFIFAAVGAHQDSIAVFLDNGFDPNSKDGSGYTPLMRVVMQDSENVGNAVSTLIAAGADLRAQDSRGYTALVNAASVGSLRGVRALLENGVSATDADGRKAFSMSVDRGQKYLVGLFISKGADANFLDDSNGTTLLMVAAEKGHEDTAGELIKGGAKINAQDNEGNSALMLAAQKGRRNVVKLLMANNANASLTNKAGKTAVMLAQEKKHGDTIKELSKVRSAQ